MMLRISALFIAVIAAIGLWKKRHIRRNVAGASAAGEYDSLSHAFAFRKIVLFQYIICLSAA